MAGCDTQDRICQRQRYRIALQTHVADASADCRVSAQVRDDRPTEYGDGHEERQACGQLVTRVPVHSQATAHALRQTSSKPATRFRLRASVGLSHEFDRTQRNTLGQAEQHLAVSARQQRARAVRRRATSADQSLTQAMQKVTNPLCCQQQQPAAHAQRDRCPAEPVGRADARALEEIVGRLQSSARVLSAATNNLGEQI